MVTESQISEYMIGIYDASTTYIDDLIKQERLGRSELTDKKIVATLLEMYIDIMIKYFSQAEYDNDGYFTVDRNFFDVGETKDVMLRINLIMDTNFYLDLGQDVED